MNAFPLSAFLVSLEAEGFRFTLRDYTRINWVLSTRASWDIPRLKGVLASLLVRDSEAEEVFSRAFDDFFSELRTDTAASQIDINAALSDLRRLAKEPEIQIDQPPKRTNHLHQAPRSIRLLKASLKRSASIMQKAWEGVTQGLSLVRAGISVRIVILSVVVFILAIGLNAYLKTPQSDALPQDGNIGFWQSTLRAAPNPVIWTLVFVVISGTVFIYLALKQALSSSEGSELFWNPYASRFFAFGSIGGKRAPQIDDAKLDYVADSMGYFQSEEIDQSLDAVATVEASSRNFGRPTLVYEKKRHLRFVLILEDAFAEELVWNSTGKELAEGLDQRGIRIIHGKFYGSLAQFRTSDGMNYRIEDLDDERDRYLLLIFSNGKNLRRYEDTFILESLARWPRIAWMELREPAFWDESTVHILRCGIPVYPASSAGLLNIVSQFLKEEGAGNNFVNRVHDWKGAQAFIGTNLGIHLEYLLGEALPWVQECAIHQPVTFGLADALRRKFHPDLVPEQIGRLFVMPGTTYSIAGIRFSKQVLAVLRSGFAIRRSRGEGENVLKFILNKVDETEPEEPDSLAHLTWEATRERVRFWLEPQMALRRLKEIARSPLSALVMQDLEEIVIPEFTDSGSIWELENSYRRANALFKYGDLDTALEIVEEGLASHLTDEALLTLKERIQKTKDILRSPGKVSFFEQNQGPNQKNFRPAVSTYQINAVYPASARQNLVSGLVVIEATINEQGDVVRTKVLEGPPVLRQVSESAAVKWKFQPALIDGRAVSTTKFIVFNFSL